MTPNESRSPAPHHQPLATPAVLQALASLREALDYAEDLQAAAWDFPVELETLLRAGCSSNALRWLVRRGYAECAAPAGGGGVALRAGGTEAALSFPKGACFILTDAGASVARASPAPGSARRRPLPLAAGSAPPLWDGGAGELRYRGRLVKQFRNAASNQRRILDEFQRQRWPGELADPLPADRGVNRKQRLHDTIKNLNRGQQAPGLRFYGADAGHAVGWKPAG